MGQFLDFLNTHRAGILMLLLLLFTVMLLLHWLVWLFAGGRFKESEANGPRPARPQGLRIIFTDFLARIINDFRHLLALVIVLIFALVLAYAMVRAGSDVTKMDNAIKTVVASLGGLVGSIIGYYFGESAVVRAREADATSRGMGGAGVGGANVGPPQAAPQGAPVPPIEDVPQPPEQ